MPATGEAWLSAWSQRRSFAQPLGQVVDQHPQFGRQVAQYSPLAFDKGIDYDSYRLRRGLDELRLEWDNWFEWKLSGPRERIEEIAERFSLRK